MRIIRYASKALVTFLNQISFIRTYWKLNKRTDKAVDWLIKHTIKDEGINVTSKISKTYPEVSGYLIPTLINWGERDLACQYASYLRSIQNPDGGFPTPHSSNSAFFDTGQVLRGLIAISEIKDGYEPAIIKAIDFMASAITETGELILSEEADWAGEVPRAISLYAIAPCVSWLRNNKKQDKHNKKFSLAIDNLVSDQEIIKLQSVNHFHAYIIDALIDLGHEELAQKGMQELKPVNDDGKFAGNTTENWICTTGQFQYSLIFSKLGRYDDAMKAFMAGAKKQNRSGGWYGSLGRKSAFAHCFYPIAPKKKMYFPAEEIPWANKYYLDALSQIMKTNFNQVAKSFKSKIDLNDNRYTEVVNFIQTLATGSTVLDAGCGKGRYLLPLAKAFPDLKFVALDISSKVMDEIPDSILRIVSPITQIDAEDGAFDAVITIEALEHAAYVNGALKEISRVVKTNGSVLIIDKRKKITRTVLEPWETWFSTESLRKASSKVNLQFVDFRLLGDIESTRNLFFSLKLRKIL